MQLTQRNSKYRFDQEYTVDNKTGEVSIYIEHDDIKKIYSIHNHINHVNPDIKKTFKFQNGTVDDLKKWKAILFSMIRAVDHAIEHNELPITIPETLITESSKLTSKSKKQ